MDGQTSESLRERVVSNVDMNPLHSRFLRSAALCLALLQPALALATDAAASCKALGQRLSLPETRILESVLVPGPDFVPPGATAPITGLPKFCRVTGVVAPAIHFEVWLPAGTWNGKFNGVGGGGLAGALDFAAMAEALRRGYATAATDTGHVAADLTWLQDEQRLVDYGHRAIHEMTLKSKEVIQAFYGRPERYSYFTGCSTGGRQGLMEVERYPQDYDGVLAGAPVNSLVEDMLAQLWAAQAALADPAAHLAPAKLSAITRAVLARCDERDGVVDGVLEDPRMCDFDPVQMQCGAGQDMDSCLTAPQVQAVRKIYAGPSRPGTEEKISSGFERGSESYWAGLVAGPQPFFISDTVARALDPDYDFRTFDFGADANRMSARLGGIWNATSPDLRRAMRSGAKVIVFHGWNDWGVPPGNTVAYYEKVRSVLGQRATDRFMRLFMLPGVEHCWGGAGPDQFDGLAALERWVERGIAPKKIVASRAAGGEVERTRPLCPYPQVARYDGRGDSNAASSFHCRQ